jgi:hypothetical protein
MTAVSIVQQLDLYSLLGATHNFNSRWSIFEDFTTLEDFHDLAFAGPITLNYDPHGWGEPQSINIMGPVTWLDLWRAADKLIEASGDSHHIFIEDFKDNGEGVLTLWTGS